MTVHGNTSHNKVTFQLRAFSLLMIHAHTQFDTPHNFSVLRIGISLLSDKLKNYVFSQ